MVSGHRGGAAVAASKSDSAVSGSKCQVCIHLPVEIKPAPGRGHDVRTWGPWIFSYRNIHDVTD